MKTAQQSASFWKKKQERSFLKSHLTNLSILSMYYIYIINKSKRLWRDSAGCSPEGWKTAGTQPSK
jgi:hypothetical protein